MLIAIGLVFFLGFATVLAVAVVACPLQFWNRRAVATKKDTEFVEHAG